MRRFLIVALLVALTALVFAPAAFAQDDNSSGDDLRGDDRGGQRGFDDNPGMDDRGEVRDIDDNPTGDDVGGEDLRGDDRGVARRFDDNPTGDDMMSSATATPKASATPTASVTPTATVSATDDSGTDMTVLPSTGGAPVVSLLAAVAGVLLVGSGIVAAMLLRGRTS
jgi:hypothetical protein